MKKALFTGMATVLLLMISSCHSKSKQPNIIYIMSDDHAAHAIGAYGGRLSELGMTPNLDKMAAEGLLFENAFCNNAICTPSRASIITGQFSQTNRVFDLDHKLDIEKQYLPIELKKLGYSTAVIGKWHLKNEPANFDYYKVLPNQGKYFNSVFNEKGKGTWPENIVKDEGHSSDIITNSIINYLENRDKSKPFFVMHHFKAPHYKFEYAPRFKDYLAKTEIPEPSSLYYQPNWGSEGTRGKNDSLIHNIGTSISNRSHYWNYNQVFFEDSLVGRDNTAHLGYQRYMKDYLRCVKGIDENIGRLFTYLKKNDLWDNNVIIYTSDQGMMLGEHDFKDKRWMYEESMRMPFIVHYPKMVKAGETTDLLINNTDFAPTMIELAGGKTPEYMQGRSFINTLQGKEEDHWRKATYYRYWMHMIHHQVPAHFGVRSKDYKLMFFYGKHYLPRSEQMKFYWKNTPRVNEETPHTWEFYDLKNDPQELHNRYDDPAYQDIIEELKIELKKQREELNETDEDFPEIDAIVKKYWE